MLSAKIVAQKPSGRVMPAASPLQLVAAAWVGTVAGHDISIVTATRRLSPPDHRAIELLDDKYVHRIVYLCVVQTFTSTPPTATALRGRNRLGRSLTGSTSPSLNSQRASSGQSPVASCGRHRRASLRSSVERVP